MICYVVPGTEVRQTMEMDGETHRWEAGEGLELEVSEGGVGGGEGQLHESPQKTLEDAGGTRRHIPEASWGVGTRPSPKETRSQVPPAIHVGTGRPTIQIPQRGASSPPPGIRAGPGHPLCTPPRVS